MDSLLLAGQLVGVLREGHVYVERASKNGELVWIGTCEEVAALGPTEVYRLVAYRLDIDARCTRHVQ